MRVVLSIDMEGVSQLRHPFEVFACRSEYWETGQPRMEADTVAAARGLVDGGADEVIVLDNHGGGNPINVPAGALPDGARLESWNVFDLPAHGVDGMFQLGYHSRGGGSGFISHTYVPGLRLQLDGELVSESHGRAWASQAPLLGIVGNDSHHETLGSLRDTPYLVVQRTIRNDEAQPVFDPEEGYEAIRAFACRCVENCDQLQPLRIPRGFLLEASLANGDQQEAAMQQAGWQRSGDVEYQATLAQWSEARPLIPAAMNAALAPLLPHFVGATSAEQAASLDPSAVERLSRIADYWCGHQHPDWYTQPADELGLATG
ncbi:MAG TPA: M55 family metallopeptidase [Gaiellales bacterium]|nr:M55 family metallopeptidase [Gaiellales bacterium]